MRHFASTRAPTGPAKSGAVHATLLAGLAAIGVRGTAIRQRSEPVAGLPSKAAEPDEHTDRDDRVRPPER